MTLVENDTSSGQGSPVSSSSPTSSVTFEAWPLQGYTVVEFGTYLAGPLVGLHLRHLGARVLSVVRPRHARGAQEEAQWRPQTTAALRNGKQLVELDLTTKAGRRAARALVRDHADVVIENFRPGVSTRLGIGPDECRALKPGLVHLSLPGFASHDAEFASVPAWEAVILAAAGVFRDMGVNRQLMGIPASYSPLPLASAYGSVYGALSVAAALYRRVRAVSTGETFAGETIEVPLGSALLDTLVHNSLHASLPEQYMSQRQRRIADPDSCPTSPVTASWARGVGSPLEKGGALDYEEVQELMDPFFNHYRCSDGRPFYLVAPAHLRHQQRAIVVLDIEEEVELLGVPVADPYAKGDGALAHGLGAGQVGDQWAPALRRLLRSAFLQRSAFEWEELFGNAGVPGAAHRTTAEWLRCQHAAESGLVVADKEGRVEPGPIVWVREQVTLDEDASLDSDPLDRFAIAAGTGPHSPTGSPLLPSVPEEEEDLGAVVGRHRSDISTTSSIDAKAPNESPGDGTSPPWLAGVRILDLANVIAGPTIGSMLARFGAEVVKVDSPSPTYAPDVTVVMGMPANAGKRSALIDLKDRGDRSSDDKAATGRSVLKALVATVDIVVVNCTVDCLERFGLSPRELKNMNPRAILMRFDAWGGPREGLGPRCKHLGYDDNVQAMLGIMERFGGGLGRVEEHAHIGTIDVVAGVGGALAAVAALLHRERRPGAAGGTIVARASLAALGNIVQFPFCCGRIEDLEAEALNSPVRLGPFCRGEHALMRCYEAGDGEWFLLAASINAAAVAPPCGRLRSEVTLTHLESADPGIATAVQKAAEFAAGRTQPLMHRGGNFDDKLARELVKLFSAKGLAENTTADMWVERLSAAGLCAVRLHSLGDLRDTYHTCCLDLHAGPTFQFITDPSHPMGKPVVMFAPCSIRSRDAQMQVPLPPAPRYGEHTEAILFEIGVDPAPLIARGVAATGWSSQYLPVHNAQSEVGAIKEDEDPFRLEFPSRLLKRRCVSLADLITKQDGEEDHATPEYAAASAAPPLAKLAVSTAEATATPPEELAAAESLETAAASTPAQEAALMSKKSPQCPICFEVSVAVMELSCGHPLCRPCAVKCSSAGLGQCPLCRHPHLLDPARLASRKQQWRHQYGSWRAGRSAGASGELSSIGSPTAAHWGLQAIYRNSAGVTSTPAAGDLAISRLAEAARSVEQKKEVGDGPPAGSMSPTRK